MTKKIVIVGAGEFGEIASDYFTVDSEYEVAGFAVERQLRDKDELCGFPVIDLETIDQRWPPATHSVFVAITYTQLNRARTRLLRVCREKGYTAATYVSSHAFVWRDVVLGGNCFIFENNVVQRGAAIGDNVVLWSGNHVGHRSRIADNCFLSSHVVVAGYCTIGENCFFGVNSAIGDRVSIGRDCVIAAGSVVLKDCDERRLVRGNPAVVTDADPLRLFGVKPIR